MNLPAIISKKKLDQDYSKHTKDLNLMLKFHDNNEKYKPIRKMLLQDAFKQQNSSQECKPSLAIKKEQVKILYLFLFFIFLGIRGD